MVIQALIQLVAAGKVDVLKMVSAVYPLERASEAFEELYFYLFFGVNDEISIKLVSLRYVLEFFVHNPKTLKILTSKVIKNLYTILLDAYL